MNLKYITCSDPREDISVSEMMRLLHFAPQIEIGVQASPGAMATGRPRHKWFQQLMSLVSNIDTPLNVALHVNYSWCNDMCSGRIPPEIQEWLMLRHVRTNAPAVRRIQLNIGDGTNAFDANKTAKLIHDFPDHEFIFPYNSVVSSQVAKLHDTGANFSLLYDSSYGYGKSPDAWYGPVYSSHPMGYAGGLSPENVAQNLDLISEQLPSDYTTWIDAEGRLMKPGTRQMDLSRARSYVDIALRWSEYKSKQR